MSVSRKDADAMGKLIAAMNAATGDGPAQAHSGSAEALNGPQASVKKGDAVLTSIMENFRAATDSLIESGEDNRDFQMDLTTNPTPTGVQIGSWEIAVRSEEGFGKYYDITHKITKEPIASDLRLYEAAYGIVKALNEGETFTSARVKAVLELERDYSRALSDAVSFASRMKITEGAQHDIAEARYGEARRQALTAKNSIEKLTK